MREREDCLCTVCETCQGYGETIERHTQHKGCFVLGTNIEAEDLSDEEVLAAYKAQSQV